MTSEPRNPLRNVGLPWVAALTLCAIAAGMLAPLALAHTDDGCEIELHCIACRAVVGHERFVPSPHVPVPVAQDSTEWLESGFIPGCGSAFDAALPSRAPPARI